MVVISVITFHSSYCLFSYYHVSYSPSRFMSLQHLASYDMIGSIFVYLSLISVLGISFFFVPLYHPLFHISFLFCF